MPSRRSEAEWERIAEEWRSSGKPVMVFSKQRHISPDAFRRYLKLEKHVETQELPFVELSVGLKRTRPRESCQRRSQFSGIRRS